MTHEIEKVYEAALALWEESGVENHGEGHPGVSGPTGETDNDWTPERGMLDGAIETLKIIRQRAF